MTSSVIQSNPTEEAYLRYLTSVRGDSEKCCCFLLHCCLDQSAVESEPEAQIQMVHVIRGEEPVMALLSEVGLSVLRFAIKTIADETLGRRVKLAVSADTGYPTQLNLLASNLQQRYD